MIDVAFTWATREDAAREESAADAAAEAAKAPPSPTKSDNYDDDEGGDDGGGEDLLSNTRNRGSLSRYQFMQTLIKLSVGRYIPSDTLDVSDAVDKLMGERVSRLLPPDAKIDPNTFRDERLYTLEVESMFRTHLNSLHALFEAYAGVGPTGQPDLMSL